MSNTSMTENTTTTGSSSSSSTVTPTAAPLTYSTPTINDYDEIVFVRKSSSITNDNNATTTNTADTSIPIGYYTSCTTKNDTNHVSRTTQVIAFQYIVTRWTNTANNNITDRSIFMMEAMLHEYLVPELLQSCTYENTEYNLQFDSLSSLPIDTMALTNIPEQSNDNHTQESISSSSACTSFSSSSSSVPCMVTIIDGAITVETLYPSHQTKNSNRPKRRRASPQRLDTVSTTFSDPILLERMGSSLVSFFSQNIQTSNFSTDTNISIDWNVSFLTITNFVSQDQPLTDTFTINTNDNTKNNNNNNNNTASGIAIDQTSTNLATIDKSIGIVIIIISITALLITLMMIVFRKKEKKERPSNGSWRLIRRRRCQQQTERKEGIVNHNDTTFSLELENDVITSIHPVSSGIVNHNGVDHQNNNNDDDDVSYIVNDIIEQDSQAEMIGPCRDWELYHTTNDTPPMFIPSFDDDVVIGTTATTTLEQQEDYNGDGEMHRWI